MPKSPNAVAVDGTVHACVAGMFEDEAALGEGRVTNVGLRDGFVACFAS